MDERLLGLSCFAGIGGIDLAIRRNVKTICYIENEKYCQDIIKKNVQDGWLDDAPIWSDICSFDGRPWNGKVDIVFGGFPCQSISLAGKGEGIEEGTKSGLWFEMLRIIEETNPKYVFLENVAGIRNRGLNTVLKGLSKNGFDAKWIMLRANDIGAPHKRERWFCLAWKRELADTSCI